MLSCELSPPVEPVEPVPEDAVLPVADPVSNAVLLAVDPVAAPVVPLPPDAVLGDELPVEPVALPVVVELAGPEV